MKEKGRKDHNCESCGKSFSHTGVLKRHIHTVHEGHKDNKCDSCGKAFTSAKNLKKHIHIVHEGNKAKAINVTIEANHFIKQ